MKPNFIAPSGHKNGRLGVDETCIVSCDIGNHYADEFAVTRRNCNFYCADVWRLYYTDYPEGCPTHDKQQYAFKIYCVEEAIRAGFRRILWMDSSLAPIGAIDALWEAIENHGWYAAPSYNGIANDQGWRHWASTTQSPLGEWCSDKALDVFGISREEAFSIPLALTGLVGLDMQSSVARNIWHAHKEFYAQGVFNGAHVNRPGALITPAGNGKFWGHVSHHPRVQGHRHDETSLSFILHTLGLRPMDCGFWTLESRNGFIGQFVYRYGITYKGREDVEK